VWDPHHQRHLARNRLTATAAGAWTGIFALGMLLCGIKTSPRGSPFIVFFLFLRYPRLRRAASVEIPSPSDEHPRSVAVARHPVSSAWCGVYDCRSCARWRCSACPPLSPVVIARAGNCRVPDGPPRCEATRQRGLQPLLHRRRVRFYHDEPLLYALTISRSHVALGAMATAVV
jgi:hypothetical protein